ncbi:mannitol dehydrogenase family protein [Aquisalinus flavus]|uniref:Mannitol 2-dehydrogenase n=1 Tax=Aquisalinus flavus TaxID=1526572 RepID=A0A8J2V2K3_9PROT|nr:mannitol dehydrogenase family protein [Aquisalinus flavus]MBD0426059.1 mannitol dehydrogenase family protein [Aquisalinus flavus]UNE48354.1 mannitol dehydrogenase family protein [Aquisalinus flavus]GGD11034.1 mannitol 2-dehydrogenase [Aquisalinus flavus]
MAQSLKDALRDNHSSAALPGYDRDATGVGIVHLGPGAFFRGHQAVYTDDAMALGGSDIHGGDWAICGISLRSASVRDGLAQQDGLYTLATLDSEVSYRIIGSLKELMVAPEDPGAVIDRLADPAIKIVTLTITEKGYCLAANGRLDESNSDIAHDIATPDAPRSAIGYLVAGLARRRDNGTAPFTCISCDNLPDNGHKLKAAVIALAAKRDESLAGWIGANVAFPRTMVDSITPATDDALIARVRDDAGLDDAWPIQREAFKQWVIEDFDGPRPAWDKAGATFTGDVAAFEHAKLRLLNAPHSALAYLGPLAGHETVRDAIGDDAFERFIRTMTAQEIIPGLTAPVGLDLTEYRDAIIGRFHNPEIRHLLAQIAWDGTQKLPVRIISVIRENIEAARPVDRLCLVVAAWRIFVIKALQDGRKIVDPQSDALAAQPWLDDSDPEAAATHFLTFRALFDEDLARSQPLHDALQQAIRLIGDGAPATVRRALMTYGADT